MNKILQTLRDKAHLYKPKPFLTLNDTIDETSVQKLVRTMAEHGLGGFYAHARSGLTAQYLSEEWFRIIDVCADECEKTGMQFWIYDEMGWPSGSAGGRVTAKSADYASRWLELFTARQEVRGRLIACYGADRRPCEEREAKYFLCEIADVGYIDVLNERAVQTFIETTYEKYRARYGGRIVGFFTDEPQYGMLRMPYTPSVETLMEAHGESIRDYGIRLFFETGDYKRIRRLYFDAIGGLFLRNYVGQISSWCERYGYKLTGHMLEEKSLDRQILSCGDLLSVYSLMQTPGMDWLGRDIGENALAPRQISSICRQFGKKSNTSESYACVGYGASLQELKTIADWQIANGITNLCYIIPYSVRGRRKRDYPSGIVAFQPYFEIADDFNLYLSRFCALSAESENTAEVLLVSPLGQAEEIFGAGKGNACSDLLNETVNTLEKKHISYHVANANILRAYGSAENGKLRVGKCTYAAAVCFTGETAEVLNEFRQGGGTVFFADQDDGWAEMLEPFRDCALYSGRKDELRTGRFVTENEEAVSVQNVSDGRIRFSVRSRTGERGRRLDLLSLKETFANEYELNAGESALFVFGGKEREEKAKTLSLSEESWDCAPSDKNVLLLDRVDCYRDGALYAENIAPVLLQEKLVRDGKNGRLRLIYRARSNVPLRGAYLAVEDAARYEIAVNGIPVPSCGKFHSFVDESISRLPLPELAAGDIEISLLFDFVIPQDVRKVLLGEGATESDFNRLQDLTEVENIYLLGDFCVYGARGEGDMLVSDGAFAISRLKKPTRVSAFGESGFPFYVGEIVARKQIFYQKSKGKIEFACAPKGAAVRVFINGKLLGDILWDGRKDAEELLRDGENEVELHIYNDLRNLFGPHHNKLKEPRMVGFSTFADEPGWCDPPMRLWTDTYYLKEYGVRFPKESDED